MAMPRPLYRKSYDFVAVRTIRAGDKVIYEPGDDIDKSTIGVLRLRRWYRRRRIGVKDHPWTEAMIADQRAHARPEVTGTIDPEVAKVAETTPEPQKPEEIKAKSDDKPDSEPPPKIKLTKKHINAGWWMIKKDGVDYEKVFNKDAANARMREIERELLQPVSKGT